MAGSFIGRFVQKNGQLAAETVRDKSLYEQFRKNLEEGTVVEIYMDITDPHEKTLTQLAKVHKQIRELAAFTGDTFTDMKKQVKDRAGLCIGGNYKSFGDCSADEISLAIQAAIEIGEFVSCYVN